MKTHGDLFVPLQITKLKEASLNKDYMHTLEITVILIDVSF